jgi:2-oxoglutarate dehydrogenase E2 component (dihydrolipoamide succinyltransferase)
MPAARKIMAEKGLDAASTSGLRPRRPRHQEDVVLEAGQRPAAPAAPPRRRARPWPSPQPRVNADIIAERPSSACRCRRLRARVAERLVQSQSTNAILTTFNEVNMAPVMELRKKYKDRSRRNTASSSASCPSSSRRRSPR